MYIYIYIYIHTYIHTYTYIYIYIDICNRHHDELRVREVRPDHVADVLRVAQVQGGVDLVLVVTDVGTRTISSVSVSVRR